MNLLSMDITSPLWLLNMKSPNHSSTGEELSEDPTARINTMREATHAKIGRHITRGLEIGIDGTIGTLGVLAYGTGRIANGVYHVVNKAAHGIAGHEYKTGA